MDIDDFSSVNLYDTDVLFQKTFRLLIFGSSDTGKSFLIQNLIRSHHDKFHKIVVCGAKNELLNYPETKDKTFFHRPKTEEDLIYDPFSEIEELNLGNCEGKQILCIYDDL